MAPSVRPATLADAHGIAEVHVGTWRAAYAGIVPQSHLDGLSVGKRAELWTGLLEKGVPARMAVWVADDGGRVVGFANAGPCRDDGADDVLGELRAIYVAPSHWDTGLGAALHDAAVGSLRGEGFSAATLWVLAANRRARAFYERRGWRPDGLEKAIALAGSDLAELRYRLELAETRGPSRGS